MGKKTKKPGRGKEKTEKKTVKAEEKRVRRETKKLSPEDDIDAILVNKFILFCNIIHIFAFGSNGYSMDNQIMFRWLENFDHQNKLCLCGNLNQLLWRVMFMEFLDFFFDTIKFRFIFYLKSNGHLMNNQIVSL